MRLASVSTLCLLLLANAASAQDLVPEAVASYINAETIVAVRIDVQSLDLDVTGPILREWLDPVRPISHRAASLGQALQKLKSLQVPVVHFLLATGDLPGDGLLVIQTSAEKAVVDALEPIWPDDVEHAAGVVIAGSKEARDRVRSITPVRRPEFSKALQAIPGMTLQVAVAPSDDARRVLREFVPVLPAELGGGTTGKIVDGAAWLGIGMNLSPKFELRGIAQSSDVAGSEALQQAISATLTTLARSDVVKQRFPNAEGLRQLLTPRREEDRLVIALTEANGAAKQFTDQVAIPLLELARANSARARTVSNLKYLALAMHNFHDANKAFPPAAVLSKNGGQKLLSWRVQLLPYLGEGPLYRQFHLDEPWDSDHNKTLIKKMPDVFDAGNATVEMRLRGMTTYLVPVGEKTAFEKTTGSTIRDISDGTSNTIMIVEALREQAVSWTRPDDLPFDPKVPSRGVVDNRNTSFWTAFCDGSVRRLDIKTNAENLRRYFQMNDGEVIDPE